MYIFRQYVSVGRELWIWINAIREPLSFCGAAIDSSSYQGFWLSISANASSSPSSAQGHCEPLGVQVHQHFDTERMGVTVNGSNGVRHS